MLGLPEAVELNPSNRAVTNEVTMFVASFISSPYNDMDAPPAFLVVPANGEKSVPIAMGQSGIFHLRYMKIAAFALEDVGGGRGAPVLVPVQNIFDAKIEPIETGRSWMEHLKMELYISSHVGRAYFTQGRVGGSDVDSKIIPIGWQGIKAGQGMVKMNYLIPNDGSIMLRLYNTHPTKDLYIHGALFGLKARFN